MSENSAPKVTWQPISALPLLASMIDGLLDEVKKQCATLQSCRSKPYVFDNRTVGRIIKVYSAQAEDLRLYEGQLTRWKNLGNESRKATHGPLDGGFRLDVL